MALSQQFFDPSTLIYGSLPTPTSFKGVNGVTGGACRSFVKHSSGRYYAEAAFYDDNGGMLALSPNLNIFGECRALYHWTTNIWKSSTGSYAVSVDTGLPVVAYGVPIGFWVDFEQKKIGILHPNGLKYVLFEGTQFCLPVPQYLSAIDGGEAQVPRVDVNFGQKPFAYKMAGFLPWNSPETRKVTPRSLLTLPVAKGGGF